MVVVALFMVYGAFDLAIQRFVIMPSFNSLAREEATKNMQRAQQALEREIHHLGLASNDWAYWDDAREFVSGRNGEFIGSNLTFAAFTELHVNLMLFYDVEGRLVWGRAYDLATETSLLAPERLDTEFRTMQKVMVHKTLTSAT